MKDSRISWTVHTFNPWTGCTKVSPGCDNCYAEAIARRRGVGWGPHAERRRAAASTLLEPLAWNRTAERKRRPAFVFSPSMADLFDNRVPPEWRVEQFALMRATPWLTWQALTKRPQNILKMLPPDWGEGYPNVWIGVSAENQEEAGRRLPVLLGVPARVRFVSAEPLLEKISLAPWLGPDKATWVIAGCETKGKRAGRPFSPDWARALRDECVAAGVSFFYKQEIGMDGNKVEMPLLDGRQWTDRPAPNLPVAADLLLSVRPPVVPEAELAERLNAAYQVAQRALRDAVARGREFGDLLLEIKPKIGHGRWEAWVRENCVFAVRSAQVYMRLARELPKLPPEEAQRVADLSLRDAIAAVSGAARNLRALPEPIRENVLEAAPAAGLNTPLKRDVNEQRYRAKYVPLIGEEPSAEPEPPVWHQHPAPPASPYPGADLELASALLAFCRERAAADPSLTPEVICETLNAVYCEIQANGLAEVEELAA